VEDKVAPSTQGEVVEVAHQSKQIEWHTTFLEVYSILHRENFGPRRQIINQKVMQLTKVLIDWAWLPIRSDRGAIKFLWFTF